MTTTSLKIERQNYTIENVQFPDYFVDKTAQNDDFVEIKETLREVFTEFFHSESFKTNDCTERFRILDYSLNQMLDDLFMAHNRGRNKHIQEQLDKIDNREKEESQKNKV